MSRKDTGKSSFKRYYRTSGIGRGELSSICQLKEEGRLHGIIMCGWDTDTETKKMGKVGHVCAIIRPEEAKKVCNTQMRGSRRAALWGISLVAQPGWAPLFLCPLHSNEWGTSGELKQRLYARRERTNLPCLPLSLLHLSSTQVVHKILLPYCPTYA